MTTATLERPQPRRAAATGEQKQRGFRPDIEAARAVAVLLVVLYHAGAPFLPGGYVGVDVFFVLSGFLITTHLMKELLGTGRVNFARFYARRIRRLGPMAALVIVFTVIASWILISGIQAAALGVEAVLAALFSMNIYLAFKGVDYQANQDPSPLQHYWSLSLEEQFYLVWPLLMVAAAFAAGRFAPQRRKRLAIIITIAVICVASFVCNMMLIDSARTMAYFLTPTRAWQLGVGALVAALAPQLCRLRVLQNGWVVGLGFSAMIVAGVIYTKETPFPGTAALLPTIGAALVVAGGLTSSSWLERFVLSRKPVQWIGELSYGWYLWHWPLLVIYATMRGRELKFTEGLVIVGISLWFALCSKLILEDPVRFATALAKPVRSLGIGLLSILLACGAGVAAMVIAPQLTRSGPVVAAAAADQISASVLASQTMEEVPANLTPGLDEVAKDKPELDAQDGISCMIEITSSQISSEPGGSCVAGGTEKGSRTVVLVGDSHAYQWMPAMREIAKERDWRLVSLSKSGCPFIDVQQENRQLQRDYTECYAWRDAAMARIKEEDPDMIIQTAAIFSERKDATYTQRWLDGTARYTAELVKIAPVYSLEDSPYPRKDVPKCAAQNASELSECSLPPQEAFSDYDRRKRTLEVQKQAGSEIITTSEWFCGPDRCPVVVGNVMVYSDNSHVSQTYSRGLALVLGQKLPKTI